MGKSKTNTRYRQYQRNKVGRASNLVSEQNAITKIALQPKDMRKMAILTGVYPRENPKDKNSPYSYFHKKDVSLINNNPFSWYLREHASWLKHYKKKFNRNEKYGATMPKAPWDQLIRSRYVQFTDAVRDLGDCLETVALFAQMSGSDVVPSETIVNCQELLAQFHYYVSHNHLIKKGFIAQKGFFFEAELSGVPFIWVIPHKFPFPNKDHESQKGIDYEVLYNFLELYQHLLGFINAKLFINLGMKYPPQYDKEKWDKAYYIGSIIDSRVQEEETSEKKEEEVQDDEATAKLQNALNLAAENINENEVEEEGLGIFHKFVFTIDNTVPLDPVSMIIISLGGTVIWDNRSTNPHITHTVYDRKQLNNRFTNRIYVQPQYIFDCLNADEVLKPEPYFPGEICPEHVSPWDKIEAEEDIPDDDLEIPIGDEGEIEITEEIKKRAQEDQYQKEFEAEIKGEEAPPVDKDSIIKEIYTKRKDRKEEKKRLAATTLSATKNRLYKQLKEKEEIKMRKRRGEDIEDKNFVLVTEEAFEEEEEGDEDINEE